MSRIYAYGNTRFLRRKFDGNVKKVVRFRRKRSDGNTSKRCIRQRKHVTAFMFPQWFYGFTYVSINGFLKFRCARTGSNPKYSETVPNMCKVWENRRCYRSIPSLFTMPCQLVLFKIVPTRTLGGSQDTL